MSVHLYFTKWLRIVALLGLGLLAGRIGTAQVCTPADLAAEAEKTTLVLYEPCVLGGPLMQMIRASNSRYPDLTIMPRSYKPSELPSSTTAAAVVVTTGAQDMQALVRAGKVEQAQIRTFAINNYPLAVITAASRKTAQLKQTKDLALAKVRRISLDDTTNTSLGAAGKTALTKLGLWAKVQPKIVVPKAGAMVLDDLVKNKVDAAIVFKNCLLEGGKPPKTIRIVSELPLTMYPPIVYQIAPMKGGNTAAAQQFIEFLCSQEGKDILLGAGLKPN
jgi:molybdate transport system substrate-binding protein